jgi:hypothetical protein
MQTAIAGAAFEFRNVFVLRAEMQADSASPDRGSHRRKLSHAGSAVHARPATLGRRGCGLMAHGQTEVKPSVRLRSD